MCYGPVSIALFKFLQSLKELLSYVEAVVFCADLKEFVNDDTTDGSTSSPQKSKLLIDMAHESSGTSTEFIGSSSTSETEIASDWSQLAGLTTNRKSQQTLHATQVCLTLMSAICIL